MALFLGHVKLAWVVAMLLFAHPCHCSSRPRLLQQHPVRLLLQQSDDGFDVDSTYKAFTNARIINPPSVKAPAVRNVYTGEDAEAVSASQFTGVHRLTAPVTRRTYAVVAGVETKDDSRSPRKGTVKPRARSIIDRPSAPKLGSGNDIEPILVMGGMAYAQTYTGAKAMASTDSIAMSKGSPGRRRGPDSVTAMSYSIYTNYIPALRSANPARGSVGVSNSNRVGALAMSGSSNGKIALAQADSAVAMAQTERLAWYENP